MSIDADSGSDKDNHVMSYVMDSGEHRKALIPYKLPQQSEPSKEVYCNTLTTS